MSLLSDEPQPKDFVPVPTSPRFPSRKKDGDWLDTSSAFSLLALGKPRSGKGKFMDKLVEKFWFKGYLTIWLFSALGFENLYAVINKDCKERWRKTLNMFPDKTKELPSCLCTKPIPSIWMIPNYVDISKRSMDSFIGFSWNSWIEYHTDWMSGKVKEFIPEWEWMTVTNNTGILMKPKHLHPLKVPLKIMSYEPPSETSSKKNEQFREDFRKMVITAKKDDRIIINSPSIHPSDHQGRAEKFGVPASVLRYIKEDLYKDEIMRIIDETKWVTRKDEYRHNFAIIINELRSMCPSAKLSGEKESGISKRGLYDFLPEKRHSRSTVCCDSQSPTDIYDGIRMQLSTDYVVCKRITEDMIGSEYLPFYQKVDKKFYELTERFGVPKGMKVPLSLKIFLLEKYHICRLSEVPDNYFCLKFPDGMFEFHKVEHAQFHHKMDKTDEFFADTGIKFKIKRDIHGNAESDPTTEKVSKRKLKQEQTDVIMQKIYDLKNDPMEPVLMDDMPSKLKELEEKGLIPDLGFSKLSKKTLQNRMSNFTPKTSLKPIKNS